MPPDPPRASRSVSVRARRSPAMVFLAAASASAGSAAAYRAQSAARGGLQARPHPCGELSLRDRIDRNSGDRRIRAHRGGRSRPRLIHGLRSPGEGEVDPDPVEPPGRVRDPRLVVRSELPRPPIEPFAQPGERAPARQTEGRALRHRGILPGVPARIGLRAPSARGHRARRQEQARPGQGPRADEPGQIPRELEPADLHDEGKLAPDQRPHRFAGVAGPVTAGGTPLAHRGARRGELGCPAPRCRNRPSRVPVAEARASKMRSASACHCLRRGRPPPRSGALPLFVYCRAGYVHARRLRDADRGVGA